MSYGVIPQLGQRVLIQARPHWFSLSLGAWVPKNLARRRMVSAGAMLLDRLGPPGFRFTEFRFIDFRAPRLPYLSPLARARALLARPWFARCYGVARQREGPRQNSIEQGDF